MNKYFLYLLVSFMGAVFSSCDDEQSIPNGYVEHTVPGSVTAVLQGYLNADKGFNVIKADELHHPFYIDDQQWSGQAYKFIHTSAKRLDAMDEAPKADSDAWQEKSPIVPNGIYWLLCNNDTHYRFIKMRVAYVQGNNVGIEYVVTDRIEERPNINSNANNNITDMAAQALEMPHINPNNFFVPHYVTFNGKQILNISMEWNKALHHSSWVAFSWDKETSADLVSRGSSWKWDPSIPFGEQNGVEEANHKNDGFDKGHLCASEDRVYCKEANDQTFYFSNVSPQIGNFNQFYWAGLESIVRGWGRSTQSGKFDKVYVVKGGTTNNLLRNFTGTTKGNDGQYPSSDANGFSKGGIAVPAYYYMAFLAEKDGKYTAIALLVPHSEKLSKKPSSNSDYQQYAVSIDELEKETGIDFFCNLSDDIEDNVEKTFSISDWSW